MTIPHSAPPDTTAAVAMTPDAEYLAKLPSRLQGPLAGLIRQAAGMSAEEKRQATDFLSVVSMASLPQLAAHPEDISGRLLLGRLRVLLLHFEDVARPTAPAGSTNGGD